MPAPTPSGDPALGTAADALAAHLLGRMPAGTAHDRDALAALPPPVARIAEALLDAHVDRAAPAPESEWLDADRVHGDAQTWRDAARRAAHVPAAAWPDLLGDACRLAVAHLVRPAETLAAAAFDDGATGDDATGDGATDDDVTADDTTGNGATGDDATGDDATGNNATGDGATADDATADDTTGDDTTGDGPHVEIPTVLALRRFGAFEPYPYLPDVAARYTERERLTHIDRAGLERLLCRIDRRMVAGFSADEWAALLAPLTALLGPLSASGGVPAALLAAFFEAKGRDDLAEAFAGPDAVTPDALRARLARVLHPAPPEATLPDTAPPEETDAAPRETTVHETLHFEMPRPATPQLATIETPLLAAATAGTAANDGADTPRDGQHTRTADPALSAWLAHVAAPAADETPLGPPPEAPHPPGATAEPLWKRMMRTRASSDSSYRPYSSDAPSNGAPLWMGFVQTAAHPDRQGAAPPAAAPSSDPLDHDEARALGAVDADRRAAFVAGLFGGSEPDYRATVAALADAATWDDATAVLARDVFRAHRVPITSEPAIVFTDLAQARFRR